jgi:hypothetical protein
MSQKDSSHSQLIRRTLLFGACAILLLLGLFLWTEQELNRSNAKLYSLQKDISQASNNM